VIDDNLFGKFVIDGIDGDLARYFTDPIHTLLGSRSLVTAVKIALER